jgi:hypothetical protein
VSTVKKSHYKALERVFGAEIEGRLPLQSKAKVFEELEKEGMVERYTRRFGVDCFGEIAVTGWSLTQLGRLAYCLEC